MKKPTTLFVSAASAERPCRKPTTTHGMYKGPATEDAPHGERRDRSVMYADEVYEVPNDRFHRRRISKGDLKKAEGPAGPKYKPAPRPRAAVAEKVADKKSDEKKTSKSSGRKTDR